MRMLRCDGHANTSQYRSTLTWIISTGGGREALEHYMEADQFESLSTLGRYLFLVGHYLLM
jgi:hypothetical protein